MPFLDTALTLENFPVGESRCVILNDAKIGLFRLPDGLFAIDNVCPHRGAPLNNGFVTDGYVTCPWHQWQFQLKDGICQNIPGAKVASYPVEVRDGAIWVNLETTGASS
jgi:nitrite reductase (NADH) small subunit